MMTYSTNLHVEAGQITLSGFGTPPQSKGGAVLTAKQYRLIDDLG